MGEKIKIQWTEEYRDKATVELEEFSGDPDKGIKLQVSGLTPGRVAALARLVRTLENMAGVKTPAGIIPVLPSRESVAKNCPEIVEQREGILPDIRDCLCGCEARCFVEDDGDGVYAACTECSAETPVFDSAMEAITRWNALVTKEEEE